MPEDFVRMRQGEKRPIYGELTAAGGTLTIAPVPGPNVILYDRFGTPISGFNGIAATGFDSGAQTAPRVWFSLDASGLPAGFYTLVFTLTATGSDGLVRVYRPCIEVQVTNQNS